MKGNLFQAEFRAAAAERILMPTEPPGRFRAIAAGFAEQSLEERFLKPVKIPAHINLCRNPPNPKTVGSLSAGLPAECRR